MSDFFDERLGAATRGAKDKWKEFFDEENASSQEGVLANLAQAPSSLGRLWDAAKATGGVGAEALTQLGAKLPGLTGGLAPVANSVRNVFSPPPEGESKYTTLEARGLAGVHVPKVDLPPVENPKIRQALQFVYGDEGQHWDETPSQARSAPDGKQRYEYLKWMVKNDPAYQDRYAYWKEHLGDNPTVFWDTTLSEYKESRKKDASITPKTVLGSGANFLGVQKGMSTLFELPAVLQAAKLGKLGEGLAAAEIEGGLVGAGRTALQVGGIGAATLGKSALTQYPKLTSTLLGGAIGASENEDNRVLGALGGAAAGFGAGALGEKVLPKAYAALQEVTRGTKIAKLGEAIQQAVLEPPPDRWAQVLGPNGYKGPGVAWNTGVSALTGYLDSGSDDPETKALLSGAFGLTASLTAKYLTKIPFPGLGKLGIELSAAVPAMGALGGAVAGSLIDPATQDDDLLTKTARDAAIGAGVTLLGGAAAKYLQGAGSMSAVPGLFQRGGDLTEAGYYASGLVPLSQLESYTNPVTGRPVFQKIVGDLVARGDGAQLKALQLKSHFDTQLLSVLPKEYQNAATLPETYDTIVGIIERTGANGVPVDAAAAAWLKKQPPALIEAAKPAQQILEQIRDQKIALGLMKPEDAQEAYWPHRPDTKKMRAWFNGKDASILQYPKEIQPYVDRAFSKLPLDTVLDDDTQLLVSRWANRHYGDETQPATLRDFLFHAPDDALRQFAEKRGAFLSGNTGKGFFRQEGTTLPEFRYKDLKATQQLLRASEEWNIRPPSLLDILSGKRDVVPKEAPEDLFGLRALIDEPDALPNKVLDPSLIERQEGPRFPYKTNVVDVVHGEIDRFVRKEAFGDLIEPPRDPTTGGIIGKSQLEKYLDEIGPGFDNHKRVAVAVTKSVLGYKTPVDEILDGVAQTIFPSEWEGASRWLRSMTYASALGPGPTKLGTATRNVASTLNLVPMLGRSATERGILEATRNWDEWYNRALKSGALEHQLSDEVEAMRNVIPGNLGMLSQKSTEFAKYSLAMQHWTEDRIRTWGFTGAAIKVLEHRSNFDPSFLRRADAGKIRMLMAAAKTDDDWQRIADFVGLKASEMAFWKYGRTGQGWATQGSTSKLFTMFTSWPLNFASYAMHLASSGRQEQLLRLGITAAFIDRAAREKLGLTRFTGYTQEGESQTPAFPSILPTGPLSMSEPPLVQALQGAGRVLGAPFGTNAREGFRQLERNLPTLTGVGLVPRAYDVYNELDQDEPRRAANRLFWGSAPPRGWEEE